MCGQRYYHGSVASCLAGDNVLESTGPRQTGMTSQSCAVPQGTKVGPVVFLAMVNSVAELQPNRWKFVDDITVASRRKLTADKNPALQQAMSDICDTACNDHMLINGAKCSTMHITACNKAQDFANITARPTEIIPHVTAMKLLGVVIQQKVGPKNRQYGGLSEHTQIFYYDH